MPARVRIGFAALPVNGPVMTRERAIETAWPRSVPPSAMSRYHQPSRRNRCGPSACARGPLPQRPLLGEQLACLRVDDRLMDTVQRPGEIAGAVLVPGQVGVDSDGARRVHGVAPLTGGVVGPDDQMTFPDVVDVGRDEPERAVMVAQRRSVDARAGCGEPGGDVELRGAGQDVADLFPLHQVGAVEDRYAREVLEARIHQVEVVAHPADRGIRVEAGNDGIHVHCSSSVTNARFRTSEAPGRINH